MTITSSEPTKRLSVEQRERYHDQGFLIVRGLFAPEEIQRGSQEADKLFQRDDLKKSDNIRCRWQTNETNGACQFETFDPVIDIGPVCRELAYDVRLLEVLHDLYGEPACLFKDKLILKRPGMKGYNLHQDWIAWERFPRSFLTVLIPFDRAAADNGCTEVFPGYHKNGPLSPEDGEYHELSFDGIDESKGVLLELGIGDIAIFDGFAPHRSGPNNSERWRRQLYLSYNKQSDGGDFRKRHYAEFHHWLRKKYAEYAKNNVYFA
ncbi:MAG: phytanoyl-CoA dioxygenase family protein [Gemmataceae bacterium]